jgi:hypothetical protein
MLIRAAGKTFVEWARKLQLLVLLVHQPGYLHICIYYIIHSVETSIFTDYSIELVQIKHIFITIRFVATNMIINSF